MFRFSRSLSFVCAAVVGLSACSDSVTVVQLDPKMEVEPTTLEFGDIQVGTSSELRAAIRNTGEAVLTLKSVREGVPFDEPFSFAITGADTMTIAPGSVAFVDVTFTPTSLGEANAILHIEPADAELESATITIKGSGVTASLTVDPQLVSFGNVVVQSRKTVAVTVTNGSSIEADVEYIAAQNVKFCGSAVADPSTFCVAPTTIPFSADNRFRLAPGASTTLNVSFTPVIAGTRETGKFILKACAEAACDTEVKLDGVGIESGFRCDPEQLSFGQVNPGSCLTKSVACENIANEQVTIVDWGASLTGAVATSDDYEVEAFTQARVLGEGDSIDVSVTYCPATLGSDEGLLVIETDNTDPRRKYVTIPLDGTGGGPDIEVQPPVLNFGQVSLIAPARRTISVQNVGFADLEVTEILVDSAGTGAFTAPGAAATLIPVGGFYDITIEFQPLMEGQISSSIIIRSTDQDEAEVEIELQGEGVNLPPCSFEVAPENLGFGVVERGRISSRAFEIRNVGTSDCLVTSARLVPGTDPEFSMPDGDITSLIIPPGSSTTLRLEYSPTAVGTNRGQVEFSISSPTNPFNIVELTGTGADASLLIVPNDLDFGVIGVNCSARARQVTIYNTGSSAAEISSIDMAAPGSPAFSIVSLPAPLPGSPLQLQPGESTTFEIGFFAAAIASYAAAVEISGTFNGQPVTYVVSLQGRGDTDATQVDEFQQLGRPKVDILFVIDDSCSMSEEQASLSSNFTAFIQFASAQALDYQIGVTTTDVDEGQPPEAGRLMPVAGTPADRIVTPRSQPSPEQAFQQNANVGIDNRTFTEKGLDGAYLALSNPLIFGHNNGFVRQDAVLSIIFVSDEEDMSANAVDFYINFFLSIKGFRNTNLFTASSIVGDNPSGCRGGAGNAQAGARYIEVANRTGGVFQSICTADWSRALEDLSTTAFGFKSRFFLTNQPVVGTISVFVDGVEVEAQAAGGTVNWSYDYPTNSINFSPFATPEPGADIRVEYVVECL